MITTQQVLIAVSLIGSYKVVEYIDITIIFDELFV